MGGLRIRGAREHNLRDLDLDVDHQALVVVCGRSGSGKSSLAFDTIHAESRRRYLDVLALGSGAGDRGLRAPAVDLIEGLPPTVALSQHVATPSAQATVGTWSDLWSVVAVLFGRAGVQHCPSCDRPIVPVAQDDVVRDLLALPEGTALHVEAPLVGELAAVLDEVRRAGFSRLRVGGAVAALEEVDPRATGPVRVVVDRLKVAPDRADRIHDAVRLAARVGRGAIVAVCGAEERVYVDRPYCLACDRTLPVLEPRLFALSGRGGCPACAATGSVGEARCGACGGTRLSEVARVARYGGDRLEAVATKPLVELAVWVAAAPRGPVSASVLDALAFRLAGLLDLGVAEPSLVRGCLELSTSELQRLRLARQASAGLTGVLYVLDEPTAGLDEAGAEVVVALLRRLVDEGNTVLAVSHHAALIRAADRVVEIGPGAGVDGGLVVFDGSPRALAAADTATGAWLSGRLGAAAPRERAPGALAAFDGVTVGGRSVALPVGGLGVLAGPGASGKTRALEAIRVQVEDHVEGRRPLPALASLTRTVEVEGSASRMMRSNPATWVGAWEVLRTLFAATREAQVRGLDAGAFSLNQPGGRCEACKGTGEKRVDLDLLADVFLPCPTCDGARFAGDALEVRWKGRNPSEILDLRVDEALPFLAGHPKLERSLRALQEVGLGYVPLGQPAHTLSGGETQRLRLARELARADAAEGVLILLDDPTRGLHPADVVDLVGVLRRFCDRGGTVWVATSDLTLAAAADHTVALG